MMPGGGVRKAAASSSREEAAGRGGSPTTFSTPRDLPRGPTDAQAKPDNVADVRRPQGANFPFLPHMVIGRRVPSLVPETPPPPPPPEVSQLPTAFHVPIPRDLPPGPWLPDEMSVHTTEMSRREDSDDQDPSSEGGFQRNLWHERRNGVSVDKGDAIFSMNRKNPSSLGRDRRSKVNNGGVGYQKRTTGSVSDIGIDGGRFFNRSKDNDKPAAYDRIPKMHAMSKRHYEHLQKLDLQDCQRQVTRKTQPIVQRNPLLDSMSNQKVKGQWVAVTKDENHNLEAGKQNDTEVKDDNSRDGFSVNDIDQDDSYFDEQTKEFLDGNKIVATPDSRSYVDLISDAMEGNPSKTELENEEEMEELLLKLGDFAEEELLDKLLAEPKDKSSTFKNAGVNPVGKDLVSSSSRRSFRRGVHCRFDIEDSTPGFLSVYRSLVSPAEQEKCKQNQLLRSLTELVKEEWPNAQLHLFGSCANSFGLPSSDVDVCLSVDDTVMNKQNILLKLADILRSKNFLHVEAIANARVPIIKMIDPETEISCDICINNLLAVANTKLLRDYAQIDDRLHQLAFIVKQWAKARGVNDTYQGTLSSYAYVLMCIHFLQLRNPAILPCLQEMKVTYFFDVDGIECAYFDRVETLHDFGSQNNESIARLVWEFFHYWAYSHDYINHVVSVRTGKLISKRSKNWTKKTGKDRHLLCIEDPFETSHDLGRAVDMCTLSILREEFERAADILQCDPNPWQVLFEVDSKQYGA